MEVCKNIVKTIEEEFEQTVTDWVKKVETFCEDLPWPLDWFCKVVTTLIKVVTTIVFTIVKVYVTLVCYPIVAALTLGGEIINLILSIPIIGPIIKWWIGALVFVWSQFVGAIDAVGGLVGIRPIKHLRLHIIILMRDDRTLTVPPDRVGLVVQRTESIFRARADVKIHTTVHQVNTPSPRNALYVDTGAGLLAEDMTGAGFYFQTTIAEMLWEHNFLFAIRVGAPIVAFIVDGVGTTSLGCSSGPLADYICVEGGQMLVPRRVDGAPVTAPIPPEPPGAVMGQASATLAHEMGHACGLLHDTVTDVANGDPTNLMYGYATTPGGMARGDNLSPFQRAVIRSSPHVTYL